MYTMKVFSTVGLGLDVRGYRFDSYKEMMNFVEELENKIVYVFGEYVKLILEKIVFNYPSGKSFTKKY